MQLMLVRDQSTRRSTPGRLYLKQGAQDVFLGYTLEDVVRPAGEKIPGQTAIPAGSYTVRLTMSNRFKKILPLLDNVPMFSGVRIHGGNTSDDTEGCILVGRVRFSADKIGQCAECLKNIMALIHAAEARRETVTLTIEAFES